MKLLYQYLSRYRPLIALALLFAAVNQVFSLLDPHIFGTYIIDPISEKPPRWKTESQFRTGVLTALGMLIGVAMISRIAKAFQDYTVSVVMQKFGAALYTDGLKHALRLPYAEFEDQRSGETLSVLQKARADCERLILNFVNILFGTLVGIVFVTVYALRLPNGYWVVLTYLGGATLLAWLTGILSKRIKTIQKSIVKETTALSGATTESLRNIELVKSLGLTQQEVDRLNNTTYKILKLELKKVKGVRSISFVQGTFVNLLRQAIMFCLLYLVFGGSLTVGKLITLQFYSFFIFGPLQELGNIILSYREAQASLENLTALLARPVEEKPARPQAIDAVRRVAFEGVSFQHNTAARPALEDIHFEVKLGETIAFVGPSGSGKTTMVKLLVGLYHPKSGRVCYNDHEGSAIDFDELRAQIGLVTQDTQLFSGTIKENLLFVAPSATDEDIHRALHQASCDNLLARAEKGIDTSIGEGGLKLSGGERQRLSIARALLRAPRLLIFDEATSALDSLTEEDISQTVQAITAQRGHITVMIAHRLSTVLHADRIYVLEGGRIIETGTHRELLEEKGLYYAMWRQQIGERKSAGESFSVAV